MPIDPSKTLQTHPDVTAGIWAARPSRDARRTATDFTSPDELLGETGRARGELLGVLVSTGRRWKGGEVAVGGTRLVVGPDEEHLVFVEPAARLLEASALTFIVRSLDDGVPDTGALFGEPRPTPLKASRLTTWEPADELPASALSDGERALELRRDAKERLVMVWYHQKPCDVFYEIDILRRKSPGATLEVTLTRDGKRGGTWYRAKETVFDEMPGAST